jgi:PAS domain S-box-containing protein
MIKGLFLFGYLSRKMKALNVFNKEVFSVHAKAIALDEVPAKVIIVNRKFQVVFWNNRDEKSFGYLENEILGKIPDFLFFNGYRLTFVGLVNQWAADGILNERNIEMGVTTKNGSRFYVEARFISKRIIDYDYLVIILRDISREKNMQTKYEKELDLYKYGEKVGRYGTWYWDVVENRIYHSEGLKRLFQIKTDSETSEFLIKKIHPDDRNMVKEYIKNGFEKAVDYTIPKYRIVGEDLKWKPVMCITEAKKNENGKLIAFLGFIKFLDE